MAVIEITANGSTTMNWRKAFAVVGVGLVSLGAVFIVSTTWPLQRAGPLRPPDRHILTSYSHEYCPNCAPLPPRQFPACEVAPADTSREVTVDTSFPLTMTIKLRDSASCQDHVSISAPTFNIKPDSQSFDLPDKEGRQSETFTFLLEPQFDGNQLISINSDAGQYMMYYTVRPSEFVPSWMAPFIGPLLSVLGPTLTLPWWIERRQRRREQQNEKKKEIANRGGRLH